LAFLNIFNKYNSKCDTLQHFHNKDVPVCSVHTKGL